MFDPWICVSCSTISDGGSICRNPNCRLARRLFGAAFSEGRTLRRCTLHDDGDKGHSDQNIQHPVKPRLAFIDCSVKSLKILLCTLLLGLACYSCAPFGPTTSARTSQALLQQPMGKQVERSIAPALFARDIQCTAHGAMRELVSNATMHSRREAEARSELAGVFQHNTYLRGIAKHNAYLRDVAERKVHDAEIQATDALSQAMSLRNQLEIARSLRDVAERKMYNAEIQVAEALTQIMTLRNQLDVALFEAATLRDQLKHTVTQAIAVELSCDLFHSVEGDQQDKAKQTKFDAKVVASGDRDEPILVKSCVGKPRLAKLLLD